MKQLFSLLLLFTYCESQAQVFKKRSLDEQITKELTRQQEGYFSHFQVTYGYYQQKANFDGFNDVFRTNPTEYPTFKNQFTGFETSLVGWKPNKKWKLEANFKVGFIPTATTANNSVSKWEISGSMLGMGYNVRRELFIRPNFWLDAYAGLGFGFVGVGIKERFGTNNTNPSLQSILSGQSTSPKYEGVSQAFLNGTIGLAGTALLRFKTKQGTLYQFERGIPLTFKLGYNANLAAGNWSNEYSLSPQPKSSLSGLTFSVGMGFYGKYSKK